MSLGNTPAKKTAHAQASHSTIPGAKRIFDDTDRHSPNTRAEDPRLRTKNVDVMRAPYGPFTYSLRYRYLGSKSVRRMCSRIIALA